MAHGITLQMRAIKKPEPQWVHQHIVPEQRLVSLAAAKRIANLQPYVNLARDQKRAFGRNGARLTRDAFADAFVAYFRQASEAA